MKNRNLSGDVIPLIAPAGGVTSGEPVVIGGIVGVAVGTAAAGKPFELHREGVFTLPTAAAFAVGEAVYVVGGQAAKVGTFFGYATEASADNAVKAVLVPKDAGIAPQYAATFTGDTTTTTKWDIAASHSTVGTVTKGYVATGDIFGDRVLTLTSAALFANPSKVLISITLTSNPEENTTPISPKYRISGDTLYFCGQQDIIGNAYNYGSPDYNAYCSIQITVLP